MSLGADHIIELSSFAKMKGVISDVHANLATLSGIILSHSLTRDNTMCLSAWSSQSLSDKQIAYAALNVYAVFKIWMHLSMRPSVGLPVTVLSEGLLVEVHSGRKVVAHGHLIAQPESVEVKHIEGIKTIKMSISRALVTVEKIITPGYEPSNHKLPLEKMGPPPFLLVVAKSMLHTRNAEQPVDTSVSESNVCILPEDISLSSSPG